MNILDLKKILKTKFSDINWQLPQKLDFGILTSSYAFIKAKEQKENPAKLAQTISQEIQEFLETQSLPIQCRAVGPYLNLDPLVSFYSLAESQNFQIEKINESFVIDMFHPNVGKKAHVGHIRSGNLGEAMRRILSLKYETVISDSYLGDWGIQFSYITWGILNFDSLRLDIDPVNLETDTNKVLIDKFYQIYVRVNSLLEENSKIATEAKANSKILEKGLRKLQLSQKEQTLYAKLFDWYQKIVNISLEQFVDIEKYLNLNHNPEWQVSASELVSKSKIDRVKDKFGCHYHNSYHVQDQFDLTLGESFYISFLNEYDYFVQRGLAIQEGEAIYIDLEAEKLGRVYLISSEGYSLYHSRDIICRMVWAGIFGFDNAITLADLRQKHSFDQVFAVLRRVLDSEIYKNKNFGWLTREETDRAITVLNKKMARMEGFGHLNLPEGAMSTRKGRIFEFQRLKNTLEEKVKQTLQTKDYSQNDPEKVKKISVATLKWADMHRDREQDVVFDLNSFLQFQGNTGVYQLYTIARLNSILKKNLATSKGKAQLTKLNSTEIHLLKISYTLPLILEDICNNFKPHLLTNHLFELATQINSWYATYSVAEEKDENRKNSLLTLVEYLVNHLSKALQLLGIEPVVTL